jgi:hypothetical protein
MAFDDDGACSDENQGKRANHLRNEFSDVWMHRPILSLVSSWPIRRLVGKQAHPAAHGAREHRDRGHETTAVKYDVPNDSHSGRVALWVRLVNAPAIARAID